MTDAQREKRSRFESAVWDFANLCANHSAELFQTESTSKIRDHFKHTEDAALAKVLSLYDEAAGL